MSHRIFFSALLVAALFGFHAHAASPLSAEEAKARADKAELMLSGLQYTGLIEAQGALARRAFPACIGRLGEPPEKFSVVVELGQDGQVVNSWVLEESAFAQCFRDAMVEGFRYAAPVTPFFTSFSYTKKKAAAQ